MSAYKLYRLIRDTLTAQRQYKNNMEDTGGKHQHTSTLGVLLLEVCSFTLHGMERCVALLSSNHGVRCTL